MLRMCVTCDVTVIFEYLSTNLSHNFIRKARTYDFQ